MAGMRIYLAKSGKDIPLKNKRSFPEWIIPVQAGAALTDMRTADLLDCDGDNISEKNGNYCELTVLYWMWKNRLVKQMDSGQEYYGLFQYRRILDVSEEEIKRFCSCGLDVVLPFPMLHEPDIREHHQRYIKEADWEAMLMALSELRPEYWDAYPQIFSQQYFYNYNLIIAKREVLLEYCEWLFPILLRTEELSVPRGSERADRYLGYIGENLMTLYFLYHQKDYRIAHTGRRMLT